MLKCFLCKMHLQTIAHAFGAAITLVSVVVHLALQPSPWSLTSSSAKEPVSLPGTLTQSHFAVLAVKSAAKPGTPRVVMSFKICGLQRLPVNMLCNKQGDEVDLVVRVIAFTHLQSFSLANPSALSCLVDHLSTRRVKYRCASLEKCKTGRLHAHLMLQFFRKQDRTSRSFAFKGINQRKQS